MRIFVNGGTGYVGSKVVTRLIENGNYICCVKRNQSDISHLPTENICFVKNNEEDIEKLFADERFDWVLNMACSYAQGTVLYNDVLNANIDFPLKILNIAVKHGVYNFLTIGTGLPDNFNMYSFSKKMFAAFGEFYHLKHNINFCSLELEMFYGPDEPRNRFIPSCIQKMHSGEAVPLTVGTQKRDIIYIEDVLNAIMFVIRHGITGYKIIPVGTGEAPTICEIMRYIHELLHSRSELQFGMIPMRAGEPDCVADISILSDMGFKTKYSWKDGLKKMLEEEKLL